MKSLFTEYEVDQKTWDDCAEIYERQIVGGHPDILAFEEFEEDLLDRFLWHLIRSQKRPIKLMDIGCGSGRLHIRYGSKTTSIDDLPVSHPLNSLKKGSPKLAFDPVLAGSLIEVWGIDFSRNMIDLAKMKIRKAGLKQRNGTVLSFEQGSAFELKPQSDEVLPVAICLVNSIGVMQGFEGAVELFKSMRRAVESANGIAIISCYQQEYIDSYGLGQYESTMEVSGQPVWLAPDTYSSQEYKQIPRHYKLAHNADSKMIVDVFDMQDRLIQEGYVLSRDKDKIEQTIESGDINTYSEYRSHWYSFDHLDQLIHDHWDSQRSYHLKCRELDIVRAEPAQLAILDYSDQLNPILEHWNVL